jgi:hypothetical protein
MNISLFEVLGSGFWFQGSGFKVLGSGFKGSRFRVQGSEVKGSAQPLACRAASQIELETLKKRITNIESASGGSK